ncbi:hypothetical protein DH2020_046468 [Rehmannia glutinosa]|uniref:NB-ARC domain-containing protein n=1 Tax=Rehmannia glutinosa TaxID=99300 RepID=A0ABR0UB77_REHGL
MQKARIFAFLKDPTKMYWVSKYGSCMSTKHHPVLSVKREIDILEKELKFLFIFLENTPLKCDETDRVNNLLLEINDAANQARGSENLQIVSIFGMPGLGKTTLAKKLYNDLVVVDRFYRRAWCVISQTYKRRSPFIDILSLVSELEDEKILKMEDESLAEELYKSLKGRRYFIILDDKWDVNAWVDLRQSFPDDGISSRVLFTNRRKDVALQASATSSVHGLSFLSEDQCFELLMKTVSIKHECSRELADIGLEIAARCQGLSLIYPIRS